MLSDRQYMRDGYSREGTSIHIWLIAVLCSSFVLELLLLSPWWPAGRVIVGELTLTPDALQSWHLWTLLTHALLHSPSNPFHVLFTVVSLVFLGRETLPLLGSRRFLGVFIGSLLMGASAWTLVHWWHGGAHIGASAGVIGLLMVLVRLFPDQEINFFLFVFPVRVRPNHLIYGLLALDLFGLLFYEVRGAVAPFDYSASAHLGGMLAGWLYCRFFHANNGWDRSPAPFFRVPAWLKRRPKSAAPSTVYKVNLQTRGDLRSEVDRILDKINSHGFGALTEEEKRLLDEAKDLLSRH